MAIVKTQRILVQGPRGPRGTQGPAGTPGIGSESANVTTHGAVGNGVTDDTVAVQAAFDSGRDQVYFPPGTYRVGSINASQDEQVITFAPGAVLLVSAATTVTFSGDRQKIHGLRAQINLASETAGTLVKLAGESIALDGVQIDVNDDIPNTSLLKVEGIRCRVLNYRFEGSGKEFRYGLHVVTAAGAEVANVLVDGMDFDVGDDGVNATFGALLYLRGVRCEIRQFSFEGGGRALFPDGVIIVDGHRNVFRNPYIFASQAKYAIYRMDGSEFLSVHDGQLIGRNNGTWYADSEGIYSGHLAGHLKLNNVAISGWDYGVGFHGSHDTPVFTGAVIANNGSAQILLDSEIDEDDWPVSGFSINGCYSEGVQGDGIFILARTGKMAGMSITGCYLGYKDRLILVEATHEAGFTNCVVQGNRLVGSVAGVDDYLFEPADLTTIYYGPNTIEFTEGISTGSFADNVFEHTDPTFESLTVDSNANADTLTRHMTQVNTANFAAGVGAGAEVTLTFTFTGVLTTDSLTCSVGNTLGSTAGLLFTWWISASDQVKLKAYNFTGAPIGAVAGNVRFTAERHA